MLYDSNRKQQDKIISAIHMLFSVYIFFYKLFSPFFLRQRHDLFPRPNIHSATTRGSATGSASSVFNFYTYWQSCCFRLLRSIRQNAEESVVISYYTRVVQNAELMKFYKIFGKTLTVLKADAHYS